MVSRIMRTATDILLGRSPSEIAFAVNALRVGMPNGVASTVEEISITPVVSAAGENMTVVSASAADVGAVLRLSLLGANYARLDPITVTLNGTTPVAIPGGPFTRVNGISRVSGDTAGNVTIVSSATVRGFLAAGQQNQRSSRYTVPAGYRLFVTDIISSLVKITGPTDSCTFSIQGKPSASVNYGSLLQWTLQRDGVSCANFAQQFGGSAPGPFDIQVTGTASAAGIDAQVYFAGMLQDLGA